MNLRKCIHESEDEKSVIITRNILNFSDIIKRNRRRQAAEVAAERVGVRAEASRRPAPQDTSTTWSPVPSPRRRPRCRPNRGASVNYEVTTTSGPDGTPWPTFGECYCIYTYMCLLSIIQGQTRFFLTLYTLRSLFVFSVLMLFLVLRKREKQEGIVPMRRRQFPMND